MKTANVSFGKVIALSGKEAKLKRVNEKIAYKNAENLLKIKL